MYVDALGPSIPYQTYLSILFPTLSITVKPKADSLYTIVSAASVAAKVTRDAWIEGWVYEEARPCSAIRVATDPYNIDSTGGHVLVKGSEEPMGSGYPSGEIGTWFVTEFPALTTADPQTQAWLKLALEPTFGFPSLVRFSWATAKIILDKVGHPVQWYDFCR